jgi:hypothetical protein
VTATRVAWRGAEVCGGRFVLRKPRAGLGEQSVWDGAEAASGRGVIVSIGPPVDHRRELAPDVDGVAELLAVGDGPEGLTAVVEARPSGEIAMPARGDAARLGAALADLAGGVTPPAAPSAASARRRSGPTASRSRSRRGPRACGSSAAPTPGSLPRTTASSSRWSG